MPVRLFSVGKVLTFLDDYGPGREKSVDVIKARLRVQPFDATLATAIDDGLGGDSNVKASLFNLSTTDPKPHLDRVNFKLDCPRQQLEIFASTDTETARLCFDQVKISGIHARSAKGASGYALIFDISFGPVSRDELEYVHGWYRTQRAVSFHEAEPGLFDDDEEEVGEDDAADHLTAAPVNGRPLPGWDDGDQPAAVAAPEPESVREVAAKPVKPRGTRKKTGRHNPDAERAAQVKAGKGKANGALHA